MSGSAWGGSEELWSRTAACLQAQGTEVEICIKASTHDHPTLRGRLAGKAQFHKWDVPSQNISARILRRLKLSRADSYGCLNRRHYDLVVISCGWQFEGMAWAEACRKRSQPYALLIHAVNEVPWVPDDAFRFDNARPAFQNAAAIYFISDMNRRILEHQLARRLPQARVVRNPCNVLRESELAWPESAKTRLACVARLDTYSKGVDILLQVLSKPEWKARDLSVSLFGSGPSERYLRELTTHYGLAGVEFKGHVSDIQEIWKQHHALVLPSHFEGGLPMSVFEAMLSSRPCIVTPAAGGGGELVVDGVNGFVARAATADLLNEAMERAWVRRADWPALGQRAAADARKLFPEQPERLFAEELTGLVAVLKGKRTAAF